ncbi:hypothetical protein M422DRAFT_273676, partial [Sphaerobolus stellatus SS14]
MISDYHNQSLENIFFRHVAPHILNIDIYSDLVRDGILVGRIVLEKVYLKETILDAFDLPVEVIEACVGRLCLDKPQAGAQAQLHLENVRIKLRVVDISRQTAKYQTWRSSRSNIVQGLQNLNIDHFLSGFLISLITRLRYCFKVTAQDVCVSLKDEPFATILNLRSLSANPLELNMDTLAGRNQRIQYHVTVDLFEVHIYHSSSGESAVSLIPDETASFSPFSVTHDNANHSIVRSTSISVTVTLNNSIPSKPLIDVQLLSDLIDIYLDQTQYQYLISFMERYNLYIERRKYHRYRPHPRKDKGKYWIAAMTILNQIREKRHARRSRGGPSRKNANEDSRPDGVQLNVVIREATLLLDIPQTSSETHKWTLVAQKILAHLAQTAKGMKLDASLGAFQVLEHALEPSHYHTLGKVEDRKAATNDSKYDTNQEDFRSENACITLKLQRDVDEERPSGAINLQLGPTLI